MRGVVYFISKQLVPRYRPVHTSTDMQSIALAAKGTTEPMSNYARLLCLVWNWTNSNNRLYNIYG